MAKISKLACKYHEDGFVILLIYFTKACKILNEKQLKVSSINDKVEQAIKWCFEEYPPRKDLSIEKQINK